MPFSRGLIDQRRIDTGAHAHGPVGPERYTLAGRVAVPRASLTGRILNLVPLGQSTSNNSVDRIYTPANPGKILNAHDGVIWEAKEPLLASDLPEQPHHPQGHAVMNLADALISAGLADHVNIVLAACGGSYMADFVEGGAESGAGWRPGSLAYRIGRAQRILASVGLADCPTATLLQHGEWDTNAWTGQGAVTAQLQAMAAQAKRAGLASPGRPIFVNRCTRPVEDGGQSGAISAIRLAQWSSALIDGVIVRQGFDADTIPQSGRRDGTHLNAYGAQLYSAGMLPILAAWLATLG